MVDIEEKSVIREFQHFIMDEMYPCVAARAAMVHKHIACFVADHMECPKDDIMILRFLYEFVSDFRTVDTNFHSAAVIFKGPEQITEEAFDRLLWQRLQSLSRLDAKTYAYDPRVNADPSAADFSFSLKEEAFFIIGLHYHSTRKARKFRYPAIIFNPHAQFEKMRRSGSYEKLKSIVRKRDARYSGSINPMLADFGEKSEVYQYSGREYGTDWTCPLKITHGDTEDNSSPK